MPKVVTRVSLNRKKKISPKSSKLAGLPWGYIFGVPHYNEIFQNARIKKKKKKKKESEKNRWFQKNSQKFMLKSGNPVNLATLWISPRVFVAQTKPGYFWNQWFFADFLVFFIFWSEHFEKSHYNGVPQKYTPRVGRPILNFLAKFFFPVQTNPSNNFWHPKLFAT